MVIDPPIAVANVNRNSSNIYMFTRINISNVVKQTMTKPADGLKHTRWSSAWSIRCPWWRHQMETFSVLLALCAGTGEFPSQRSMTRIFYILFDLRLNKRLRKQWWGWWFETPSRPLWRHCNVYTSSLRLHSWFYWGILLLLGLH